MDADNRQLVATLAADANRPAINPAQVHDAIRQAGFAELAIDEEAIHRLAKQSESDQGPLSAIIGQREDAKFKIDVSGDRMSAHLTLDAARGGLPATRELIDEALRTAGVQYGIQHAAIDAALQAQHAAGLEVAAGTPPVNGTDGYFTKPEAKERGPAIDDRGLADYREMDLVGLVAAGTPLLRRIPATQGTPGTNVLGLSVPAHDGRDVMFSTRCLHAGPSLEDPNLLVANAAGIPQFFENGVNIDTDLQLHEVGLHTGNIHYEGDIHINGDVAAGMKVVTRGNVTITGTVEGAIINVEGDVTINGGIIGRGEVGDSRAGLGEGIAQIYCTGTLRARFVRNAWIEAGNVTVVDMASHSHIQAEQCIVIGTDSSPKGHLFGGTAHAGQSISVKVLGANTGAGTQASVGIDEDVDAVLQKIEARRQVIEAELEKLDRVLTSLHKFPELQRKQIAPRAQSTKNQLESELAGLVRESARLAQHAAIQDSVFIEVGQQLNSGTTVQLNHLRTLVRDERGPCRLVYRNGAIEYDTPES